MGGRMDAAYHRAYRAAHPRVREQQRARRKAATPQQRAARHASEVRRRSARAADRADARALEPMAATLTESDPLVALGIAAAWRRPHPGTAYQFASELIWEDAVLEAVCAILAGLGPEGARAAAIGVRDAEFDHRLHCRPLLSTDMEIAS